MGDYILLLTNGKFVSYDQISGNEVNVVPTTYNDANTFPTLDEARQAAKGIKDGKDGKFNVYGDYKVQAILKNYSLE